MLGLNTRITPKRKAYITISLLLPVNHEMTSVCFGITKVQCQKLNIIGYFFSLSYMPMHDMLYKRKHAKKNKRKKIQNALYMIASVYTRRCGSYRMYLECDSPHQAVMIMCELNGFSHILNCHNEILMQSCDVFTHNMQNSLLLLIHV